LYMNENIFILLIFFLTKLSMTHFHCTHFFTELSMKHSFFFDKTFHDKFFSIHEREHFHFTPYTFSTSLST
jgi:hypothetical protein